MPGLAAAAAILAGGRARRLGGIAKPLVELGGWRIIDRQLAVLRPLFGAIAIVTNDPAPYGGLDIEIVADRMGPGLGPLAGLDAALAWLPAEANALVCVAGDMPFLAPPLVQHLRDAAGSPALVPRLARGPEPLCARYDRTLAPLVGAMLAAGERAMHVFVERAAPVFLDEDALRAFDPELRTFMNVNDPSELDAARAAAWSRP